MTTEAKTKACVHHFMIPEPEGVNEVVGVCKKCGAERVHELVTPFNVFNSWRGDPKKSAAAKAKREAEKQKGSNGTDRKHSRSGN